MHFIDINKINFLAGIETSLRDVCFTNLCENEPKETCGEQYSTPFDARSLSMEKQTAAQFFDALPEYAPEIFENFINANCFELCQEIAWQYVATRFSLDTLGFNDRLVELTLRQFWTDASPHIGIDINGQEKIFIE
jgi:hypothetical protein